LRIERRNRVRWVCLQ